MSTGTIARVESYNGEPAIMINGTPYPPMLITTPISDRDYLKALGESGLKIHFVTADTQWNRPGDETHPSGLERTMADLKLLLSAVPDAYVMLRLNVSPPADWVNSHPEEMVTYSDGSHDRTICTSVGFEPIDGMHSLCSEAWRRDGDAALAEYFDTLEKTPYFDRIIGFFLCAGGTSEWYYPTGLELASSAYGDFSEPFRREFEKYLRAKYKDEETLRRVWKRPDATFDHPIIPEPAERQYISAADDRIISALRNWEVEGRTIGMKLDMNAKLPTSVGVFLNANGYAYVADFFAAWHESTANTIVHFSRTLKTRYPDLLVGAFYGSYGCTDFYEGSTSTGTITILDCGTVDFLAAPGVYNNREPGGVVAQREMQDSFRLRNMIYICEDDSRTHRCGPWMQRDAMALYTVKDSLETLKRDFARNICEEIYGWWFDMGGNWYNDPDILALFKRQREIANFAYSIDRTKKNEIALIYDTQSVHHVSRLTDELVLDFYRTSDLHRIGAPVDWYFHDDLARTDMPDYKMYVMLNCYYLTDAEREAVFAKARRNGATVVWLYAPGFINPDADPILDVKNISSTVGMNVCMETKTAFPHFRVDTTHPAMSMASASRRYGHIDRDVHSNIWIGPTVLPPAYLNPVFYIDDPEADILGRFCSDEKPALAVSYRHGFPSVYCTAKVLRSELLASLAKWSGCHIYTGSDDVLYANENFVAIHASSDGKRVIHFKRPCSPFEVYERRFYGHNVTSIEVEMTLGETRMWSLAGAF